MELNILTKNGEGLKAETSYVLLPGATGQIGILPGHAKMVVLLKAGQIKYQDGGETKAIPINGGVGKILDDKVLILA
jgi:F-type H+-transporting ATPase subunit epsilon